MFIRCLYMNPKADDPRVFDLHFKKDHHCKVDKGFLISHEE